MIIHANPWKRTTKSDVCPICREDSCVISPDGGAIICYRVSDGCRKETASGGYLHVLHSRHGKHTTPTIRLHIGTDPGIEAMAAACHRRAVAENLLPRLAAQLGVTTDALAALNVGASAAHSAWTFPMKNSAGAVVGIRLRCPKTSKKWSVPGGHEGLFFSAPLPAKQIITICEGPTDAAALMTIGVPNVVGRPSATGGREALLSLVRRRWPPAIHILADADDVGLAGARRLAAALSLHAAVKIATPPAGIKDARKFVHSGATAADVAALFTAGAEVFSLSISLTGKDS